MSSLKKYRVSLDMFSADDFFAVIEIDHQKFDAFAMDIVKFWMGWEERLESFDGNPVPAAIRHVASSVLAIVAEGSNPHGCTTWFNDAEGWPRAAQMGLTVVEVGFFDLSNDAIEVEEIDS